MSDEARPGADRAFEEELASELVSGAAGEAARLADIVEALESAHARAAAERSLVADWPRDRLQVLREGLRNPRFADEEGLAAELAQARSQLDAVQDLRRRLHGAREE
jgi:hypothetical protein